MSRPWQVLERVATVEGPLELRRRGEADFLITVGGRVLMNSANHRSEAALGVLACRSLEGQARPRVLVGGLGMGFTLRAVLDGLPEGARVRVAELNPAVVRWCRGELAELTGHVLDDPRVTVEVADVTAVVRRHATGDPARRFHAVVLDLYQGPHAGDHKTNHPLYGLRAVEAAGAALVPGGVLAVWGEDHEPGFLKRMRAAGFSASAERPGKGGYRHTVYLGVAGGPRERSR